MFFKNKLKRYFHLFLILSLVIFSNDIFSQKITNGLIAYFPLDNNVNEATGKGFTGISTNISAAVDRFGNPEGAIYFNGTSHVTYGDILDMGTSDMSLNSWFKISPKGDYLYAIISKSGFGSQLDNRYALGLEYDKPFGIIDFGDRPFIRGSTALTDAWHMMTLSYDRDGFGKIYVDGVLQGETDISHGNNYNIDSGFNFILGSLDGGVGRFIGSMDEISVYNRVLTPSEIMQLFNQNQNIEIVNDETSLKLKLGSQYVISCWVSEDNWRIKQGFNSTQIDLYFNNELIPTSFIPSGKIIDGWQQITGQFSVPNNAIKFSLDLIANNTEEASYFDDIRILPLNGSMKSFVYDAESQRLMAELDENNYATFYEYDKEGGLIRIKKETEKGVYTIQETHSSNFKNQSSFE